MCRLEANRESEVKLEKDDGKDVPSNDSSIYASFLNDGKSHANMCRVTTGHEKTMGNIFRKTKFA